MHARYQIQHGDVSTSGSDAGIVSLSCSQPEFKYFRFRRRQAKFGIACAHFVVGQCSILLGVHENIGIAAGIASLSYSQPEL